MNDPALFTKVNYLSGRDSDHFTAEFRDEIGKMLGRCIDIGTGPGDVMEDFILPKLNPKTTLVCSDISEPMVNFGKEKYKKNDRLSFIKLDIQVPSLPKNLIGQFDHATSFYCINWCHDMRRVFENIYDLLRPGGTAFLTFIASYPCANAYKILAAYPRYQLYMKDADHHIPVFQRSEQPEQTLKALMKNVGFKVRHCSVREKTYIFNDVEVFSKFTAATNPFINRIPADLMKEYKRDMVKEAIAQCIVFNSNNNNQNKDSILLIYYSFVVYLSKPFNNI